MRRRIVYTALTTIALFAAAACGQDPAGTGDTSSGGGGAAAPKLTITSPANGAAVTMPFTLKFDSSVPLGKTDTGMDHVHVFSDGKSDKYTVVPTTSFDMKDLTPGQHTIGVTLQHADHSPAGASAEITVMVTGGTGPAPGTPTDAPGPTY
jgi:Bacterial Ig domain